jgi:hypothetical protein
MTDGRTTRLRWTAAAFLGLLVAPGSARLQFDGLPFTRVPEVVAVGIIAAVLAHRDTRDSLRRLLTGRAKLVNIALVALTLGKVFTFAAVPFSAGFEACYRGLWEPLDGVTCERSWNHPWRSDIEKQLGIGALSRIDDVIDFGGPPDRLDAFEGGYASNWNLPFANEFPRYQTTWLDRLPFTAGYAGTIELDRKAVVPIEYVGELTMSSPYRFTTSSSELRSIVFVPLDAGRHSLRLDLTFRDDVDGTVIPDVEPDPRGPYARLHVGEPVQTSSGDMRLIVRGWAVDRLARSPVTAWSVWYRDDDGRRRTIATDVIDRPDVARAFGAPTWRRSGFNVSIDVPDRTLSHPTYHLDATLADGRTLPVARIAAQQRNDGPWEVPMVSRTSGASVRADFNEVRYQYVQPGLPLAAVTASSPHVGLGAAIRVIDGGQLAGIATIAIVASAALWRRRSAVVGTAVIIGAIHLSARLVQLATFLDTAASRALAAGLVVAAAAHRRLRSRGLVSIAVATALMFGPMIDVYRRYTNLSSHPWWGMQIFRDRVTDWLVFQGYARSILLESSLRGGEDVFYFMPGMRYVAFLLHVVFGENDVFIGVITGVALVATGLWLALRVAARLDRHHWWWVLLGCTAVVSGVGRPISRELAAAGASEVVAWSLVCASCVVFVRRTPDGGAWTAAAAGLAAVALLRPNMSVGIVVIALALTLARVTLTSDRRQRLVHAAATMLTFGAVASLGLLHNLWYGQQAVVFTMRTDPRQNVFPPGDIWKVLFDGDLRAIAWSKVELLLHLRGALDDSGVFASRVAVLLWLSAVVVILRQRRKSATSLLLLAAPVAYVVSTFPFGIMDTPERQIASLTVTFIATSLAAIGHSHARRLPTG